MVLSTKQKNTQRLASRGHVPNMISIGSILSGLSTWIVGCVPLGWTESLSHLQQRGWKTRARSLWPAVSFPSLQGEFMQRARLGPHTSILCQPQPHPRQVNKICQWGNVNVQSSKASKFFLKCNTCKDSKLQIVLIKAIANA